MSTMTQNNDLRNRIIFTIFILAVYRFGTFVPLPGIDPDQLKIMMEGNQRGLLFRYLMIDDALILSFRLLGLAPSSLGLQELASQVGSINYPWAMMASPA